MKFIKNWWILILILMLAALLRFWQLQSVPPSLNWDEAALGYNAYSILKTARDEYGNLLPLVFKSFGDYKPGAYVYLDVPFVALFGLAEFAVRAPSAIFGILAVFVIYFLVYELFGKKRLALIASLFLAISPWHLILSRPAFEANIALFFNLLGIYLFFRHLRKGNVYLLLSLFSFVISLYTYQSSKLVVPLIVSALFILWAKKVWQLSAKLKLGVISILFLALPVYFGVLLGNQGGRLEVFSVFSYKQSTSTLLELANEDGLSKDSIRFKFFHSQTYNFIQTISSNYLNHFSPRFLFFEGDYQNKRTDIQDSGMMYLFDIVFLLFGFYIFFQTSMDRKKFFLLFWLMVSPIPAALTRDLIAPLRAANMILPLIIFSTLGADSIIGRIKRFPRIPDIVLGLFFLGLVVYDVFFVLDSYFIHTPKNSSKEWVYGYREAVKTADENYQGSQKVIFTTFYNEPYIFTLFYNQYPPEKFQKQTVLELTRGPKDVGEVPDFDKFIFRPLDYPGDRDLSGSLLIGACKEVSLSDLERDVKLDKVVFLKEIDYLNGGCAFRIVKIK